MCKNLPVQFSKKTKLHLDGILLSICNYEMNLMADSCFLYRSLTQTPNIQQRFNLKMSL